MCNNISTIATLTWLHYVILFPILSQALFNIIGTLSFYIPRAAHCSCRLHTNCSLTANQVHIVMEDESYLERDTPRTGEAVLSCAPDYISTYIMSIALIVDVDIQPDHFPTATPFSHTCPPQSARKNTSPSNQSLVSSLTFWHPPRCSSLLSSPSSCLLPSLRLPPGTSPALAPRISPVRSILSTRPLNFLRSVETEMDDLQGLAMEERLAVHLQTPNARMCGNVRGTTEHKCNFWRHYSDRYGDSVDGYQIVWFPPPLAKHISTWKLSLTAKEVAI